MSLVYKLPQENKKFTFVYIRRYIYGNCLVFLGEILKEIRRSKKNILDIYSIRTIQFSTSDKGSKFSHSEMIFVCIF